MSNDTTQVSPIAPRAATAVPTAIPSPEGTDEPTPAAPTPAAPAPSPAEPSPPAAPDGPPAAVRTAGAPSTPAPPAPPVPPVPPTLPPHPGAPAPPEGPPAGSPAPPPPPGRGRRAVAVLTAAGLMLVSATGGALVALALDGDDSSPVASSLSSTVAGDSDTPSEPLSQAAAAVLPSVVSISFEADGMSGSGSGVVISSDGQILTNNHVVAQAADGGSLTVTFSDGTTADAEIVGRDPATDLAVIQAEGVSGLTPATLGSSADLNVGDTVLAIGSPLGLDGSVTSGIVSALDRSITLQGESAPQSPFDEGQSAGPSDTAVISAIQTDAAINPGNSGGALINAEGEVVGINTAIASLAQGTTSEGGNIGVGFAIPIDTARDIAQQLIDDGSVSHAFLGVSIADGEDGSGALVQAVEEGQPAAAAGLQEGDVITRVGDTEVTDAASLTAAVRSRSPGDTVPVTFTRDGNEQTVDVTLGELPQ
jgi:putative serine protease PepD